MAWPDLTGEEEACVDEGLVESYKGSGDAVAIAALRSLRLSARNAPAPTPAAATSEAMTANAIAHAGVPVEEEEEEYLGEIPPLTPMSRPMSRPLPVVVTSLSLELLPPPPLPPLPLPLPPPPKKGEPPPATRATLPVAYNVPNDARLHTKPPTSAGIEGAALPWLDVTPPAPALALYHKIRAAFMRGLLHICFPRSIPPLCTRV